MPLLQMQPCSFNTALSTTLLVRPKNRYKDLRLDLAAVTGSALPGQESQGAVARSLELAVLLSISISIPSFARGVDMRLRQMNESKVLQSDREARFRGILLTLILAGWVSWG